MYIVSARSTRSGATTKRYCTNIGKTGLVMIELLDLGFDEINVRWEKDAPARNERELSTSETLDQEGTL